MTDDSDTKSYIPPSRQGKTLIGGHFHPDVKKKLKHIAADENSSIQALLYEAVENLIKSREK